MKRRTFLYNASVGTLGLSFFSGWTSRIGRSQFSASLEDFLKAIGATPQSWLESDPTLEEVCADASKAWKKTGYEAYSNIFFLCAPQQKAIFFLCLPHPELGMLDISALVFQKDAGNEKWQTIAALSGFQLEALVRAAAVLKAEHAPDRLTGLLLPPPSVPNPAPGRFFTQFGEVGVQANLGKNKVMAIKAAVYENNQVLWSSAYASEYLQSL
ncbi:MAG: hypothetical protein HUU01_23535 [Saprospiraceae bacterium]|nr:hypothetical protein [Saprospiraceae bacterium]